MQKMSSGRDWILYIGERGSVGTVAKQQRMAVWSRKCKMRRGK